MTENDASLPTPIRQVCAIPFRHRNGRIEICVITSIKKKHWGFPKGIIDPGETLQQAALKEALEEAGLRGRIVGELLGKYKDFKWGTDLHVTGVLMEVFESDAYWEECHLRQRRWVTPQDAARLVFRKEQAELLQTAMRRLEQPS
jgi:phosphohistidine phosphatase